MNLFADAKTLMPSKKIWSSLKGEKLITSQEAVQTKPLEDMLSQYKSAYSGKLSASTAATILTDLTLKPKAANNADKPSQIHAVTLMKAAPLLIDAKVLSQTDLDKVLSLQVENVDCLRNCLLHLKSDATNLLTTLATIEEQFIPIPDILK